MSLRLNGGAKPAKKAPAARRSSPLNSCVAIREACQQARDIPNRRETDTDRSLREHNLTVYDTAASHAESLRRTRELGRGWVAAARSTSSPWCSYPIRWGQQIRVPGLQSNKTRDRKSTRLNSSHVSNSYDVFCLKKKSLK